jgi:S-methylmethionine-dependent homocysteine/selenocysteine methylase/SAM-dependent methyltransferase
VLLDGATGSELIEVVGHRPEVEDHLWGTAAIIESPEKVRQLHRQYVDVGCDVISTDTWAIPTALRAEASQAWDPTGSVHWLDVARAGVRLAREAADDSGRENEVAVAFSINGDVDASDGRDTIRLLARVFEEEPPDLILIETLSLIRSTTYATVEALLATGLPVWMSFRRCRHGVCGVYGEHWGGPEGDSFGRAARRLEELGVSALAINCIPPDHVTGMIAWLRDFTDIPLGVYPNLGYLSSRGWRNDQRIRGEDYAELALAWRDEGAQIIGGCCGVGPEHLDAARTALEGKPLGHARPGTFTVASIRGRVGNDDPPAAWTDNRQRRLFPLDFPDLVIEDGVSAPTQASFMLWKYLYREGIGSRKRCIDIGSGTGLLAVQLARNGATHVHAIDVEESATRNTLTNAFRNGVADRVSAAQEDLYPWVPEERYDVIIAALPQMPSDPFATVVSHRPRDFWGRNLVDHLIGLLPMALAEDGVAYVAALSVVGQQQTIDLLKRAGFSSRVVDFALLDLEEGHQEIEQVLRVEARSDAYHLKIGDRDATVAYLLEVSRQRLEEESW